MLHSRLRKYLKNVEKVILQCNQAYVEQYGEERLMALLQSGRTLDAVSMHKRVLEDITDFGRGEAQDDVTLLVLAVGGVG